MNSVTLPWPPAALKPNGAHGHWAGKSNAAKKYRGDCLVLAKAAKLRLPVGSVELWLHFCPPDKRRRDLDNMLASFKQGIDAVAEALGVDDYGFGYRLFRGEPVKHGQVIVRVEAA